MDPEKTVPPLPSNQMASVPMPQDQWRVRPIPTRADSAMGRSVIDRLYYSTLRPSGDDELDKLQYRAQRLMRIAEWLRDDPHLRDLVIDTIMKVKEDSPPVVTILIRRWVGIMLAAISVAGNIVTLVLIVQSWLPAFSSIITWLFHLGK